MTIDVQTAHSAASLTDTVLAWLHQAATGSVGSDDGSLDAVAADLELLDTAGDEELHRLLVGLCRYGQRIAALTAAVGQRWDARLLWTSDGSRSAGHRLGREANLPVTSAKQLLSAGRSATAMPHVRAAWLAGRISLHHVSAFAAVRRNRESLFKRDEAGLVTQACALRYAETRRVLDYWALHADAVLDRDGAEPMGEPYLHVSCGWRGSVQLTGTLDPIGGATFTEALRLVERQLYLADKAAGTLRSTSQRNAAALVELARRAFAAPPGARKPDPLLVVVAGSDSFAQLCELATGTVVAPDLLVPHLAEAEVQTIVFDDAKTAVAASPQRCFTGLLRRVIQVRDRHCQHASGCDTPWPQCDVDHAIPVSPHGGPTDQFNGRLLCPPHNRHAHLRDPFGGGPSSGSSTERAPPGTG